MFHTATVRPRRSGPRILYNTPLNSNVIVTHGYDCENAVDECLKTMLLLAGFPALDKFTAKSDLLQSVALSRSYKCTFYYKEAFISCYNMRFVSELIFV